MGGERVSLGGGHNAHEFLGPGSKDITARTALPGRKCCFSSYLRELERLRGSDALSSASRSRDTHISPPAPRSEKPFVRFRPRDACATMTNHPPLGTGWGLPGVALQTEAVPSQTVSGNCGGAQPMPIDPIEHGQRGEPDYATSTSF